MAYLSAMSGFRAFLLVLTATLFAFGGMAKAMPAPAVEPPCHEAPAGPVHHDPGKATAAASCCVGCMPAPQTLAAPLAAPARAARLHYDMVAEALSGLALTPDPRPPRA